jgi:ectoine hydroxylase-related dioxygenase (phytanoyl-CoA dioxygenase family)
MVADCKREARARSRSRGGASPPDVWRGFDTEPASRELTVEEVRRYNEDGFVVVKGMFDSEEVGLVLEALANDAPVVEEQVMQVKDAGGGVSKCLLWNDAGDDVYGMLARSRRWTHAASHFIGGVEPYHFHTKLMIKEPFVGGKWAWHQDFGYWYQVGCLNPDRMFSSILALDKCMKANGCLQVLRGSHRLGRLTHGTDGEQAGAEPEMLRLALERFELVHCEMEPGDVLFTHSNLLHMSAPNHSEHWRRVMIVAYNGRDNSPFEDTAKNMICPVYEQISVVDDGAVKRVGAKGLLGQNKGTTLAGRQAGFLDHGQNVRQFAKGAR